MTISDFVRAVYNGLQGLTFVTAFANSGVITDSLLIVLGADILMAGLLAKNLERASHA
jgi:hypothetical protein